MRLAGLVLTSFFFGEKRQDLDFPWIFIVGVGLSYLFFCWIFHS